MATVVLDPGHGGDQDLQGSHAHGARGHQGMREEEVTLSLGRLTARALDGGHRVLLTRDADINFGAAERAAVARNAVADAFVSIHFSGHVDPQIQGTETLVRSTNASPGNGAETASQALARSVQSALVTQLGLDDRGLKPGRWIVLDPRFHHPTTARCLAEVSFLTDPNEEQRLADPVYLQGIGRALAAGIDAFLRAPATGASHSSGARNEPDAYEMLSMALPREGEEEDEGEGNEEDYGERIGIIQQRPPSPEAYALDLGPENWREDAGTAHFSLAEFRCRDGTDCPQRFRGNLQLLMENLEVLRTEIGGRPIVITSGYRTPSYNRQVGGRPESRHLVGMAADFKVQGWHAQDIYDLIEGLQRAGQMTAGGLNAYTYPDEARNFVHYDVRGRNTRW